SLYALATDGSLLWQFQAADWVRASPTIANGTVVVGSYDGNLYAVDLASGAEIWRQFFDSPTTSAAVVDGVVYVGLINGAVAAVGHASRSARRGCFSVRPDGHGRFCFICQPGHQRFILLHVPDPALHHSVKARCADDWFVRQREIDGVQNEGLRLVSAETAVE